MNGVDCKYSGFCVYAIRVSLQLWIQAICIIFKWISNNSKNQTSLDAFS
jgi:hypothetical protein